MSSTNTPRSTRSPRKPTGGGRRYRRGKKVSIVGMIASLVVAGFVYLEQQRDANPGSSAEAPLIASAPPAPLVANSWQLLFSPGGGCTDAIIAALNRAEKSVHVQAYSFTSAPIAQALAKAKKRGVAVEVVLDKSQRSERYTSADFIAHSGIPTFIDAKHAIAHNKVIVIDRETTITGSFNFTKAAEKSNAENLLIIRSSEMAQRYMQNWDEHRAHSTPYAGKPNPPE